MSFDSQNFDFESFDFEVENWITAEKRNLNFLAGSFDMAVVVAYMTFGSDSAIEVVDNSVEVLTILEYFRGSGLSNFLGYYLLKNLRFDHGFAKKSPSGCCV